MQTLVFKIMLFIFAFGSARSLLLHGLSLVAVNGGYSLVVVHGLLTAVTSRRSGFSRYTS